VKNSFFLVIPSQQKNSERLKRYEEESLRGWILDLPVANPSLATRLFHDFIKDFNKTEMPVQLRLDALETLKPSFLDIEDYLRARLAKAGFPKGGNEYKILEVIVSIEKEFTIGYWMVARELTKRAIGWFQGKNIALAIQRTIKGLGNIVVTHYMMCLPVPAWVWIDLHSLYTLSVKLKKENAKVPDDLDKPSKTSTPEESYIQILLLSLTEPGGLMQREVQQVYNFLEKFGSLAKLEKKPVAVQMLQCIVFVDEDMPPAFERTEPVNSESSKLYLNFTGFYEAFDQRDRMVCEKNARFTALQIARGGETDKLPAELIDYLGQRWLGTELHGMPCFPDRLDRYFAIGLETTHELLSSDQEDKPLGLEILAESSSDRALSCRFSKEGLISIGSLVSFRKVDAPHNVRALGVVSKIIMPKQKNTCLDFELKVITSSVSAISYLQPESAENSVPQKALFYTLTDEVTEKTFIIVDSFLLKDNDLVRLFTRNGDRLMLLQDKKNVGLGYWQFECSPVTEKKTVSKPEIKNKQGYDFI